MISLLCLRPVGVLVSFLLTISVPRSFAEHIIDPKFPTLREISTTFSESISQRQCPDNLWNIKHTSHLIDWVHKLVVTLPPVHHVSVLGWKLDFIDGNCTDLTFETVAVPSYSKYKHGIDVVMRNVGMECAVVWHATSPMNLTHSGPGLLDITNSDIQFNVVLENHEATPHLKALNVTSSFQVDLPLLTFLRVQKLDLKYNCQNDGI